MKDDVKQILLVLALAALLTFAFAATAAEVFRAEDGAQSVTLRLHDKPCENPKVVAHVQPSWLHVLKAATLTWTDGKDYASCWLDADGLVYSIDEGGDPLQPIPRAAFKEESI